MSPVLRVSVTAARRAACRRGVAAAVRWGSGWNDILSDRIIYTGHQRRLKYKHRTGSTERKVKPYGSTGTDDFTDDRHNMSGQAIQLKST